VSRAQALGRALRGSATTAARPRRRVLGRPRLRTLLVLAIALVLALAGWFWLRDSSLVAVRTVEVSGVGGARGAAIRIALEQAARSMTTLHVRRGALDAAVAPFALVRSLEVSTDFPHTMRIHVVTNVAVGAVVVGGRRIPVTSDGTLLRDVTAPASLPTIPLSSPPGGKRLTDPTGLSAVAVLAAAPEALRTRVAAVTSSAAHGLAVQLAHGPVLWFGDEGELVAKWAAAAAVIADPSAAGASAIDVTVPRRPAVDGLPDGAPAIGASDIPTLPTSTTADGTPASPPAAQPGVPAPAPAGGG
jgi:cell division protein FtsQ